MRPKNTCLSVVKACVSCSWLVVCVGNSCQGLQGSLQPSNLNLLHCKIDGQTECCTSCCQATSYMNMTGLRYHIHQQYSIWSTPAMRVVAASKKGSTGAHSGVTIKHACLLTSMRLSCLILKCPLLRRPVSCCCAQMLQPTQCHLDTNGG